jgi:hypothetical protein
VPQVKDGTVKRETVVPPIIAAKMEMDKLNAGRHQLLGEPSGIGY